MVEEHVFYWTIFFYLIFSICGISSISITIKYLLETFKEYKIKRNIQINIQEKPKNLPEIRLNDFLYDDQQLQFNNVRYNNPILSGVQIIIGHFHIFLYSICSHDCT